jgi:hypothetical protein
MEEGGADGVAVKVQVGEKGSSLQRVKNVWLTGLARLAVVTLFSVQVGPLNLGNRIFGKVPGNLVKEVVGLLYIYPMFHILTSSLSRIIILAGLQSPYYWEGETAGI